MVRDGGDRRRCHVCWERGHISLDCPVRQGLLHLANMAAELNNRIRRPVPIRVYRVNTHRRRVRPRRRRGRQRQEHASERNHTGPHELPPRPAHVSPELNYGDCGPYHRDVQDLPLRPPAGDKDKENIRPTPFANPAHSQAGAAYDRHDVNMRFDSSTANHLISSSGLAAGTKMESGTPVEHVDNSASVYVQASGAVDVQITRSDTFATSNESGTHENLPSLSFNVSGDMVMTEESQAVADDYCNMSTPIVINQDTRTEGIQTLDEGIF